MPVPLNDHLYILLALMAPHLTVIKTLIYDWEGPWSCWHAASLMVWVPQGLGGSSGSSQPAWREHTVLYKLTAYNGSNRQKQVS